MNSDCTLRNRKSSHHYKKHYAVEVNIFNQFRSEKLKQDFVTNNNPPLFSVRMSQSLAPAAAPDVPV